MPLALQWCGKAIIDLEHSFFLNASVMLGLATSVVCAVGARTGYKYLA